MCEVVSFNKRPETFLLETQTSKLRAMKVRECSLEELGSTTLRKVGRVRVGGKQQVAFSLTKREENPIFIWKWFFVVKMYSLLVS